MGFSHSICSQIQRIWYVCICVYILGVWDSQHDASHSWPCDQQSSQQLDTIPEPLQILLRPPAVVFLFLEFQLSCWRVRLIFSYNYESESKQVSLECNRIKKGESRSRGIKMSHWNYCDSEYENLWRSNMDTRENMDPLFDSVTAVDTGIRKKWFFLSCSLPKWNIMWHSVR